MRFLEITPSSTTMLTFFIVKNSSLFFQFVHNSRDYAIVEAWTTVRNIPTTVDLKCPAHISRANPFGSDLL